MLGSVLVCFIVTCSLWCVIGTYMNCMLLMYGDIHPWSWHGTPCFLDFYSAFSNYMYPSIAEGWVVGFCYITLQAVIYPFEMGKFCGDSHLSNTIINYRDNLLYNITCDQRCIKSCPAHSILFINSMILWYGLLMLKYNFSFTQMSDYNSKKCSVVS